MCHSGNVIIGKNIYIGPGVAILVDFGKIIIEDGYNILENCTIHTFPGAMVLLKGKPREQNLQRLVADMKNEWKECEPLREVPEENEYVDSYCKT